MPEPSTPKITVAAEVKSEPSLTLVELPPFIEQVYVPFNPAEPELGGLTRFRRRDTTTEPMDLTLAICAASTTKGFAFISNGWGMVSLGIDEYLQQGGDFGKVRMLVDMQSKFTESKIYETLHIAAESAPGADIVLDILSGTARGGDVARALVRFAKDLARDERELPRAFVRFDGPENEIFLDMARAELVEAFGGPTRFITAPTTTSLIEHVLCAIEPQKTGLIDEYRSARETTIRGAVLNRAPSSRLEAPPLTFEQLLGKAGETKVGVAGYGETAKYHIKGMINCGTDVRWIYRPPKGSRTGDEIAGVPFFPDIRSSFAAEPVDVLINYAPALKFREGAAHLVQVLSELEPGKRPRLVVSAAEGVLPVDSRALISALSSLGIRHLGPNSPGALLFDNDGEKPIVLKLGNMPIGLFEDLLHPATDVSRSTDRVSVFSRSGTLLFEVGRLLVVEGRAVRALCAVGGDEVRGISFRDGLIASQNDPTTKYIVMLGEAGGTDEVDTARELVESGIVTKPVIALISGKRLPSGVGHAGSTVRLGLAHPAKKEELLRRCGVVCVSNPEEVLLAIDALESMNTWNELTSNAGREEDSGWRIRFESGAFQVLEKLVGKDNFQKSVTTHGNEIASILDSIVQLGSTDIERLFHSKHGLLTPAAFRQGLDRSPFYVSELFRYVSQIGVSGFTKVVSIVGTEGMNNALSKVPWAAGDITNEISSLGTEAFSRLLDYTFGKERFRRAFQNKPWNTAHSVRSIGNMVRGASQFETLFSTYTEALNDRTALLSGFDRNPWAVVKLIRGFEWLPPDAFGPPRNQHLALLQTDPLQVLEIGKAAFATASEQRIPQLFRRLFTEGIERASHNSEKTGSTTLSLIEHATADLTVGDKAFPHVADSVFGGSSTLMNSEQAGSMLLALRAIQKRGASDLDRALSEHKELLDESSLRTAGRRNPYMAIESLYALGSFPRADAKVLVESLVGIEGWQQAWREHQWGIGTALSKLKRFGLGRFITEMQGLCQLPGWRENFRTAFERNPRDAVQVVELVSHLGGANHVMHQLREFDHKRNPVSPAVSDLFALSPRNVAGIFRSWLFMGDERFSQALAKWEERTGQTVAVSLQSQSANLLAYLRNIAPDT